MEIFEPFWFIPSMLTAKVEQMEQRCVPAQQSELLVRICLPRSHWARTVYIIKVPVNGNDSYWAKCPQKHFGAQKPICPQKLWCIVTIFVPRNIWYTEIIFCPQKHFGDHICPQKHLVTIFVPRNILVHKNQFLSPETFWYTETTFVPRNILVYRNQILSPETTWD